MPSTYTTNLGIEKIASGEQSGTWGDTTNVNWDLVDQATNGIVSVTLPAAGTSGSPNDLAITDGASSDGRNRFIEFVDGGDLGATAYIRITPNDAEKIVHIRNSLSGGQDIIAFQGTYNASNDFDIPNGKDVLLKFSGTGAGATVTDVFEDLQVTGLTVTSATFTTVDIDGGTIDATVIGGTTAADGTFDTLTATTFSGLPAASTTLSGIVELADVTETNAGVSTTLAVTPDGLDGWTGSAQVTTLGTIATGVWQGTAISTTYVENLSGTNTGDETTATDSAEGIVELATQAEVDAGSDTSRVVTPNTLANYSGLAAGTLDGLTDTTITTVGNDEVLQYTGSVWENQTLAEAGIAPVASPTFTGTATLPTVDINAGAIDGTAIGAASESTGKFTTLEATGKVTFGADIVETIYALSGATPALDPANGTIQTWTLPSNSTPTDSLGTGEYITLHILDGAGYTITWPTILWIGGTQPTLDTSNTNIIEIWKVSSTLYGAFVGVAASA